MTSRLALYGSSDFHEFAKVGSQKSKSPQSLVARMPSSDIAAKVGGVAVTAGVRVGRVVRRKGAC